MDTAVVVLLVVSAFASLFNAALSVLHGIANVRIMEALTDLRAAVDGVPTEQPAERPWYEHPVA